MVSAGLFAISLALPIFLRDDGEHLVAGGSALFMGWMSFQPAWLANPLWLAALIFLLFSRRLTAAILATLAVLLAVTSFTFVGVEFWIGGQVIAALSFGFYVWLAGLITLMIYAWYEKAQTPAWENAVQPG